MRPPHFSMNCGNPLDWPTVATALGYAPLLSPRGFRPRPRSPLGAGPLPNSGHVPHTDTPKKPTAAKLRNWRISVLRARLQYRGDVQARDQRSAEAEAVRQFKLSDDERKRLVVQERD